MVKLLARLADLVARRCFRSSGYSPVALALERARDAAQVEPEASIRSFGPLAVARGAGGNRVRWMASDFGAELSDLVHLRSEEHTLNSSHQIISYAVFCLKKKKNLDKSVY